MDYVRRCTLGPMTVDAGERVTSRRVDDQLQMLTRRPRRQGDRLAVYGLHIY